LISGKSHKPFLNPKLVKISEKPRIACPAEKKIFDPKTKGKNE